MLPSLHVQDSTLSACYSRWNVWKACDVFSFIIHPNVNPSWCLNTQFFYLSEIEGQLPEKQLNGLSEWFTGDELPVSRRQTFILQSAHTNPAGQIFSRHVGRACICIPSVPRRKESFMDITWGLSVKKKSQLTSEWIYFDWLWINTLSLMSKTVARSCELQFLKENVMFLAGGSTWGSHPGSRKCRIKAEQHFNWLFRLFYTSLSSFTLSCQKPETRRQPGKHQLETVLYMSGCWQYKASSALWRHVFNMFTCYTIVNSILILR